MKANSKSRSPLTEQQTIDAFHDVSSDASLIETDSEVKSYIYQQINEFSPYVTPDTLIMVVARNPTERNEQIDEEDFDPNEYHYRIAIIMQEDGASIEAEAYHDDIFEAIKLAKEALIGKLSEIRDEVEDTEEEKIAENVSTQLRADNYH